jgi:stage III sporulation protein AE
LTGVLNGAVDKTAAKAAKTTISAALPVVGKILSDAAETVVSGAGILRAGIGSLGLLCVFSVCAIPYVSLGIHYVMYQLMSGFASAFSDKRISALLEGFSDVYALMLGAAGTVTFVLFASIVSLMRAVSV